MKIATADDKVVNTITITYLHFGRVTVAELRNQDGEVMAHGSSQCHPHDIENEDLGRAIAARRAFGEVEHNMGCAIREGEFS